MIRVCLRFGSTKIDRSDRACKCWGKKSPANGTSAGRSGYFAVCLFLPPKLLDLLAGIGNLFLDIRPELISVFRAGEKLNVILVGGNVVFQRRNAPPGITAATSLTATAVRGVIAPVARTAIAAPVTPTPETATLAGATVGTRATVSTTFTTTTGARATVAASATLTGATVWTGAAVRTGTTG